jgi:recombination protein RecT
MNGNSRAMAKGAAGQPPIVGMLQQYKTQIAAALPRHMNPDRMARIVTTEVRKVPALLNCDPISLFGAVIQCSQLGLEPGNGLGHAYLLPYGRQVQLIIGYRGMIDLARRSGQIISLSAHVVRENDTFEFAYGLNETLHHVPAKQARGDVVAAYAVAKLKDGGHQFEVMWRDDIDAIRAQSKASKSGPWVTHYEEMARKTVVRRLFKYLPVSIEIQQAVGLDEQADAGVNQQNAAILDGQFSVDDGGIDLGAPPPPADSTIQYPPQLIDQAKSRAPSPGETVKVSGSDWSETGSMEEITTTEITVNGKTIPADDVLMVEIQDG